MTEVLTPCTETPTLNCAVAGVVPVAKQRFIQEIHVASNQGNPGGGSQGGNRGSGSSNRGFASMDPVRQREIASEGGKAAHEKGTAHQFSSQEAREAGSKGGQAAHERGTAHQFDSEEAREAGRKGGQAAHQKGTAHEFDSEEAREAGRKGGQASHGVGNQVGSSGGNQGGGHQDGGKR
jgi:general stress protein YciG